MVSSPQLARSTTLLIYDYLQTIFYTDWEVALGYINNEARRFHTYIGNRVQHAYPQSNQSSCNILVVKTTQLTRLLVVLLFEKYLTTRVRLYKTLNHFFTHYFEVK